MNTSKEITELLSEIFITEGYDVTSIFTYLFKKNEKEFDAFIEKNNPDVILYDIAVPYDENFVLFKKLQSRESAEGIPFVLTSTNKEGLESMVGEKIPAYELIGKPFDLQEIIDAVNNAYQKVHFASKRITRM